MKKKACILIFIALSGCTHISRKEKVNESLAPPTREWVKTLDRKDILSLAPATDWTEAQRWWLSYQQALSLEKSQPQKSCEHFLFLSQKKDFPLWDLAFARAQLVCETPDPNFPSNPISQHPWYLPVNLQIQEKTTQQTPGLKDDILLLIEKSKRETQAKKKEAFILKALELARQIKDSELVDSIEGRLQQIFPRHLPRPPAEKWLEVAADFRQFRQFPRAQKFYHSVLKHDDPEAQWAAWKGLRQIEKTKQDRKSILAVDVKIQKWFQKVLKKQKKPLWIKRWHDHTLMQIRQLWTEDQYQTALKKLRQATLTFKNIYPRDEIFFLLARMREEKGSLNEAQENLNLSLKEKESTLGLREKVLWSSAWLFYKQGKYAEAIERLNENLKLNLDASSRYKYLFWKARSEAQLKMNESQKTYALLAEEDPLGFYGLLAYKDRSLPLPALKTTELNSLNLNLRSIHEIPAQTGIKMDWLISLEEKEVLEESIKSILENSKALRSFNEDSWLKLFSAFAQAQLYLPLFANLNKIKPQVRDQLLRTHPELIFPRPYDDFVLPAAKNAAISPWFIYSIMRQESAFDPEARSAVDAMGLLQLMPDLASRLARQKNIRFVHPEELFEPEVNIPLGAWELKNLMERYRGNSILAVAAYNANGKAISGWIKNRLRPDPIEFLEEIPYEETKAYIKLVFRNYIFYERLDRVHENIPVPETLFAWPPR